MEMQKRFHAEGDLSTCAFRQPAAYPSRSASLSAAINDNSKASEEMEKEEEDTENDYAATDDPFYDKVAWFQPLGRQGYLSFISSKKFKNLQKNLIAALPF